MWPFGRKVEAPAAEGPRPVPAPVIRRDWVGLPPIQRFVGAHPLTAPSDRFRDDLTTHQDPSVSSDTMGHQVSAEAPPGLVLALARPTTRSDGPAMIPRPRVQRSVAGAVAESGEWEGDEAVPELTRPTPLPASAHTVAARELPVVAPEPAVRRLISLPPDAEPAPVPSSPQRSRAVPAPLTMSTQADEPSAMPPASAPRLTLGQSRRMGLGAPIKHVPDHSVQRAATELPLAILPQRDPMDTTTEPRETMEVPLGERAPMDVSRGQRVAMDLPPLARTPLELPLVQRAPMDLPVIEEAPTDLPSGVRGTRTVSLGAPLTSSLETSDESRLDLPLARRPPAEEPKAGARQAAAPAPSVQLSAATTPDPGIDSSPALPPAVQRLARAGRPAPSSTESGQTLMRSNAPTATPPRDVASTLPLVTDSPARASGFSAVPARDAATMAPLVGAMPLRPSATLQRSASTAAPNLMEDQRNPNSPPENGMEDSFVDAAAALTLPQREREDHGTVLQRALEDAPSMTLPQIGRQDRTRQEQPLPLVPSRGFAVQRASQAVDDSETGDTGAPSESDAPVVQGAWYDSISAGVKSLTSGAGSSVASTVGSALGGVASSLGGHKTDETDMDELAGKLYDRIRSRLKTELLVDRERAGFLTDLR